MALTFLDADDFFHSKRLSVRRGILYAWQKIINTQGGMFIYVIESDGDYESICFDVNGKNISFVYELVPPGCRDTSGRPFF